MVDGGDGQEDRPVARGGGGRQAEREVGLYWRTPRLWRALGEDNHYVYGEMLGISSHEIRALAEEGVI